MKYTLVVEFETDETGSIDELLKGSWLWDTEFPGAVTKTDLFKSSVRERKSNLYLELFEELDRARSHIVNSGVDHELKYEDLNGVEELCSKLWIMGMKEAKK